MPTSTYRFIRGSNTKEGKIAGFFSTNQVSTDALRVLSMWSADAPGRSVEKLKDEADELIARLTWNETDDLAGSALEDRCERVGVAPQFIRKD